MPASLSRGGLALGLMFRDRKKNGEWSKPKVEGIDPDRAATLADPQDRRIVTALHGANQAGQYGYYGYGGVQFKLTGPLLDDLLPQIAETGRLHVRPTTDRNDLRPLTWDGQSPWVFTLEVVRGDSGKQYVLTGSLRRGDQRESLERQLLLVPGAVVWPDRIARFDDQGAFAWVRIMRRQGPMLVPLRDKDKLVTELVSLPALPRLELPEEMRYEEVALPPRPRLVIKPSTAGWRRDRLDAQLTFLYGEQSVPASPRQRGAYDAAAPAGSARPAPNRRQRTNWSRRACGGRRTMPTPTTTTASSCTRATCPRSSAAWLRPAGWSRPRAAFIASQASSSSASKAVSTGST